MKTKRDYEDLIAAEISNYPIAAQLYRVRDPRLMASLSAMAAMMGMLSEEQDVAASEPFTKARDMTVKADATAKGVLPFGKPTQVQLTVENGNSSVFTILTGRTLQDRQGRRYVVDAGISIPAASSAILNAHQMSQRSFDHTVTVSMPFYMIEVPAAAEGAYISEVRVSDSDGVMFSYVPEFVNVENGEKCFHLLSDELQKLYIEFGADTLAGYQPGAGEVFTVTVIDTDGDITLVANSKFAFEYTMSPAESLVTLTLTSMLAPGAASMSISAMREITNYSSIYNSSAVYLGNFDFLVRRNIGPFRFLSIWNEQTEERVRGADIDNINTLFVSAMKDGVADVTLREQIKEVILKADDSYKIRDVAVDEQEIPVVVLAKVAAIYDFSQVQGQIRELILESYGRDSEFAKAGQNRVLYKNIYKLIEGNVPALAGERSDLEVEVDDPDVNIKPEHYRYVSEASLIVTVEQYL